MEKFILDRDIPVICIQAKSFPEGVLEAHQSLHTIISYTTKRAYFGLSSPDKSGRIIYKAAAEILVSDGVFDLEKFTIKQGLYYSVIIKDFMNDVSQIGVTFQKLISMEDIDPKGCCIEWYINESDVRCMVPVLQ